MNLTVNIELINVKFRLPMKGEPALGPEAPRFRVEYDHILQVKVPPLE